MSDITIKTLSEELVADYLRFFDEDAFRDNPDWASCYCAFFQHRGSDEEWERRTGQENRALVEELAETRQLHGYLAYVDQKVVGWCQAAPSRSFPSLHRTGCPIPLDGDQVGAIVCFVVAPAHRRTGVARTLLQAAVKGLAESGMTYAEAYPVKDSQNTAANFPGPLGLYVTEGFDIVREVGKRAIVRKRLR